MSRGRAHQFGKDSTFAKVKFLESRSVLTVLTGVNHVGRVEVRAADQHRVPVQLRRRGGPRRVPLRRLQGVPSQLGPSRERALLRQGKGKQC